MRRYAKLGSILTLVALLLASCAIDPSTPPEEQMQDTTPLHPIVDWVVLVLEGSGMAIIMLGAVIAAASFIRRVIRHGIALSQYERFREHLGQIILLGLEFLVAADIVATVTLSPTARNVSSLALIILVRTFLSFTLEVETTGRWPWQRNRRSEG